jgi:hypothetical protein
MFIRLFRFAKRVLFALAARASPKGPGTGDGHWLEKAINVITCIPIILTPGFRTVGCIALLYHATPVQSTARTVMRKFDYWSISGSLLRANRWQQSPWMLLAVPFFPVGVSAYQGVLLIGTCPKKQMWAVLSGGLFVINCIPNVHPLVHASWHCCAAKTLSLVSASHDLSCF